MYKWGRHGLIDLSELDKYWSSDPFWQRRTVYLAQKTVGASLYWVATRSFFNFTETIKHSTYQLKKLNKALEQVNK